MTEEKIRKRLDEGEGFTVEYKECVSELSNSVFETVASFSNRYGGYMLLGVKEVNRKGVVIGVNRKAAPSIKQNFINMLNNPNKIVPSLYLKLEEFEIDGELILWVYIPISSQVEFCDKKIWDRNGDADQYIDDAIVLPAYKQDHCDRLVAHIVWSDTFSDKDKSLFLEELNKLLGRVLPNGMCLYAYAEHERMLPYSPTTLKKDKNRLAHQTEGFVQTSGGKLIEMSFVQKNGVEETQ